MIRKAALALAFLGCAPGWALDYLVGGSLGAGWFTAPSSSIKTEGLRTGVVVLGDTWIDKGNWGIGLDGTSLLANHEGLNRRGSTDKELIAITSAVLMTGRTYQLEEFPARIRLAVGAGAVHSWDDLTRGGHSYQQESWGLEFHLSGIWERKMGPHGLVRIRLAAVKSATVEAPITGTALRSASDWSRMEFTMGWAWRS